MDLSTIASSLTTAITQLTIAEFRSQVLWALVVGIILAFVLGFAMGANDVANAFGTSVGSGVLSLTQAYILATIFETLGALLVGYNVTDTIRKGVIDVELYQNEPKVLFLGQLAILAGCSGWLLIATFAQLPVSTTHSITGATVGFGLVTMGTKGIHWIKVSQHIFAIGKSLMRYDIETNKYNWNSFIAMGLMRMQVHAIRYLTRNELEHYFRLLIASWFISPVLSGIVSSILYMIVDWVVLRRNNPFRCGLIALPFFYWFSIAFTTFAVSYQGSKCECF
ncbi:unnamed protein product [Anisakis simplex]|uniref:Phosphate transporter family protein n=1 Tax=Anisakis simplex TaxID=6269 RepID=A0A0M3K7G2_ANISI|nr:unnamed protein product [Anisakis simplex]